MSDGQNEDEKVHGEGIDVIPADIGGISFEARADYWFSAPYDGLHLGTCLSGGLPEEAPVLRVDIGYMVVFMKAIRAGASGSWNVGTVDITLQARMTIGCVF